jgi:hypothetical protein
MRQIAFVVRDVDRAMRYWSETLGVGPFFVKRRLPLADFRYRGAAAPSPTITIALANSGAMQVELIQQHDERPSIYRDFLAQGREGLQHLSAWLTRAGFDRRRSELLEAGVPLAQEGTIPASGVRLAYFGTDTQPGGVVFEIADLLEPGQYQRVAGIARAAERWDGTEPVREVEA